MRLAIKNILVKIKKPFEQGLSPNEVTKAIIISLLFTVFPVFGLTTMLLTLIAFKFKLNLPVMIIVSYIAAPLQFILFLPFIYVGEFLFDTHITLLSMQEITNSFNASFWNTFQLLLFMLACGVSGWLVIALPLSFIGIILSNRIFKFIQKRKN
jgi:uncharacterized protein (DUF2062 family)